LGNLWQGAVVFVGLCCTSVLAIDVSFFWQFHSSTEYKGK